MQGQINIGTNLGDHIYKLAQRKDVNTIVEIGTWNGLGSTLCVLEAIKNTNKVFMTIEAYQNMQLLAEGNLKEYKAKMGERFKILHGTIIKQEDMNWIDLDKIREEVNRGVAPSEIHPEHLKLWLACDLDAIASSPYLYEHIPTQIDMLILDGGEYSTYPEWLKLKDRTKIFVLDDTKYLKCKRIREEMINSGKYRVIVDNQNDRNGYTILELKNVQNTK